MAKTLFITGTDTGVGKTCVTAIVGIYLQLRGVSVGVMKPLASGCEERDGVLVNEDADFLKNMTGIQDSLDVINPVRYREPLAPLVAARRAAEATEWVLDTVRTHLNELESRHEVVLVEGVGGLLVPIAETHDDSRGETRMLTCIDLAKLVGGKTVVVARRNLGTINHTVLTVDRLRAENLPIAGLIFCDAAPVDADDIAVQTSPAIIAEMTGLPILGMVPFLDVQNMESLEETAQTISPKLIAAL